MIDLHCHSTYSDGTLTPEELAEKGRSFSVFAVTDHDNCDGCKHFLAACAAQGHTAMRLAGLELSIDPGEGYSQFHLLGLGIDPDSPTLNAFLDKIRDGRNERNKKILARLAELGMPVPEEELAKYANGKIVARPHIARVLMDHGWATSVKDAFERFVGKGKPAFVSRYRPPQAESIAAIHAAGGVAVMAHPRYWTQDADMLRTGLRKVMDLGLDGIEAVYRANLPEETILHLRVAKELGLAVTAGSDFHGANKPEIPLGMKTDDDAAFLAPILSRLNDVRKSTAMHSNDSATRYNLPAKSLAEIVVECLAARSMTCGVAESCTGGGIGKALTDIAGSSSVFWGGVISYDNSVKQNMLGVSPKTLNDVGPISAQCAEQMARGARERLHVDLAVSVTGLAGPGGDGTHPAGYVWFGIATPNGVRTENVIFNGDRESVRKQSVEHALKMLLAACE